MYIYCKYLTSNYKIITNCFLYVIIFYVTTDVTKLKD